MFSSSAPPAMPDRACSRVDKDALNYFSGKLPNILRSLDFVVDIMSNCDVTKDYKTDFAEAVRELLAMTSEREKLETRIAKQKKRVAALYELADIEEASGPISGLVEGLTDACRVVFRAAEKPLTPAEIRDRVQALGLPPQANLLASIHTTIKRMKEAGEIDESGIPPDLGQVGAAYQWRDKGLLFLSQFASLDAGTAFERFKRAQDRKVAKEKAQQK